MKKKIVIIVLVTVMTILTLTGCSDKEAITIEKLDDCFTENVSWENVITWENVEVESFD